MFNHATKNKHGFLTIHTERDEVYKGFDEALVGEKIDESSSEFTDNDDTSVISSSLTCLSSPPPAKKVKTCINRANIAKECQSLSTTNTSLKQEVVSLKEENTSLKDEIVTLKRKLEVFEGGGGDE
jgi:hypothetical protein